jgi:TolA-binding protein
MIARTKVDSAPALGAAFLTLARGDTTGAANALAATAGNMPELASLSLYLAGQLFAAQRKDAQAMPLWQRVVEQYAMSAEAPAAELEWARALKRGGDSAGAIKRLEHLILSYPQSALVPQARRDLEIAKSSIPGVP